MYGFEWQEKRGVEGTGFVRALRGLLTAQLPSFFPTLRTMIEQSIREEIDQSQLHDGKDCCAYERQGPPVRLIFLGYAEVALFPMVKRVVTKANSFVFFGEELCESVSFPTQKSHIDLLI